MKIKTSRTIRIIIIRIAIIMAFVLMVVGFIVVEKTAMKVIKTTANLAVVNDNIKFCNSQKDWEGAKENSAIRQKDFYESQDIVVRTFSKAPYILKLLMFILPPVWPPTSAASICGRSARPPRPSSGIPNAIC